MPRVWKQRREYKPDGALYARRRLSFGAVIVQRGEVIPPALIRSERKHAQLWRSGQAGHEPRNAYERKPYGKPSPAPTALPAVPVQPGLVLLADFVVAAEALRADPDAPATPSADVDVVVAQVKTLASAPPSKPKKK